MRQRPKGRSGRPAAKDDSPVGKLSRSQVVRTFGVGSIFEMRSYKDASASLHSVMIAGLDHWDGSALRNVPEPVLQRALKKRCLKMPPAEDEEGQASHVPAFRFPSWLVCSNIKCSRLGKIPAIFEDRGHRTPRCKAAGCNGKGIPARLIVGCFPSEDEAVDAREPGHIDDFPWAWWAHSEVGHTCSSPQLRLESARRTAAISGLVVRCHGPECNGKVGRSLAGVFGADALRPLRCFGRRPWLEDSEPGCTRGIRSLQRGASNVYFPVTASAISIPPHSQKLVQLIGDRCNILVDHVGKEPVGTLVNMVKGSLPGVRDSYSDKQIEEALNLLAGVEKPSEELTEREQRVRERKALTEGRAEEDERGAEFLAEPVDLGGFPILSRHFNSIVQVHRLREVRALRGFRRIVPPAGMDAYNLPCAPLSKRPTDWLPAIEVRGEGVYLELNSDELVAWKARSAKLVASRTGTLRKNHSRACQLRKRPAEEAQIVIPPLLLVHSLSHLLIKQLSLQCGYSSASLQERIYVDRTTGGESWAGILIYTSTASADGTLGGLVRQADPKRFARTLEGAIAAARWCSSDPLCIESRGQGTDALNLAACHACCLVSETSCELRNIFLDRGLLVGTPADWDAGFFRGVGDMTRGG